MTMHLHQYARMSGMVAGASAIEKFGLTFAEFLGTVLSGRGTERAAGEQEHLKSLQLFASVQLSQNFSQFPINLNCNKMN